VITVCFKHKEYHGKSIVSQVSVLCEQVSQMNTIMLGIAAPSGACDDMHSVPGMAHLNEHMHVLSCNQAMGSEKLRRLSIEAFTEREETYFLLQALPDDFAILLEWLRYYLNPSEISKADFNAEKRVVLEELITLEDGEIGRIDNNFYSFGYIGSPYSLPLGGYANEVRKVDRRTAFENMLSLHLQQGISIAVIGNLAKDCLLERVGEVVVAGALSLSMPIKKEKSIQLKPGKLAISSNLESIYFLVGYPAFNRTSEYRVPLYGLSHYLGSGVDNLLFKCLRRDNALLYFVECECHLFKNTGHIAIKSLSSKNKFNEALDLCLSTCGSMKEYKFDKLTVQHVKHSLKKTLLVQMEIPRNILLRLLKHEQWFSEYYSHSDDIQRIEKIDSCVLAEVSRQVFDKPELIVFGEK
jgi:predicted Zn-dependent peptidase